MPDLKEVATQAIDCAKAAGVSAADVVARKGNEVSVIVRAGKVEMLTEARAQGVGIRIFLDNRSASTYTTEISPVGLREMVKSAITLARVAPEDPDACLPSPEELKGAEGDLELYFDDVSSVPLTEAIRQAQCAERAALSCDPRLVSDGASFSSMVGSRVLATSDGFLGKYCLSLCCLSAAAVVEDKNSKHRASWYSSTRSLRGLDPPEKVGRMAARRALQCLGSRSVRAKNVPIVFDPSTAGLLLSIIFEAARGDNVHRGDSFLTGRLGQRVAADAVTILSDPTIVGGFGSVPFDDEGIRTRRTVAIKRGILTSYILNTASARKLGMKTTGNAVRGLAGGIGIAPGNFFMEPGPSTPNDLIANVKDGLYVTETLGFGVNMVTGDFSRGAKGHWINSGVLTFPVDHVTIAGNLRDMLMNISDVANDLTFQAEIAAPTLRIEGMTVAGVQP